MDIFAALFKSDFMPHGHCYLWLPELLWLHVISDGLIALSYATIPVSLAYFVKKRKDLQFKWIFLLFGAFILCCGATHALEIYAVWVGAYYLTGVVKAVTALVSVSTAAVLIPLIPKALRLPSPAELEEANRRLVEETRQRLQAEAELARQEKDRLFKTVVDAAPNGMLLVAADGSIVLGNHAAATIFGYEKNSLKGMSVGRLVPEGDRADHGNYMNHFFQNPEERLMAPGRELAGFHQSGHRVPIEIGLNPVDWDGELYALASIVDITERRRQAELLQQARSRFERAVSGASDGLWEWIPARDSIWYSDQFAALLGLTSDEKEAHQSFWTSRAHPGDEERLIASLEASSHGGNEFQLEHRLKTTSDGYQWFLAKGKCFREDDTLFVAGSITHVHDRKKAEAALEEKNRFLDSIYKGVRHGIFVIDVPSPGEYRIVGLNQAHEAFSGMRLKDVRGKRIEDLVPEYFPRAVADAVMENYRRCVESREAIEYEERIPFKQRQTWWLTNLTPMVDGEGRVFRIIGAGSEITRLKELEADLRDREEYARKIIDHSLNGLYIYDLESGTNSFINPSYTKITGYSLEDLRGLSDFNSLFHPEDLEKVQAHVARVLSTPEDQSCSLEYRFQHKLGHWIWCLSSDAVFTTDQDGKPQEMIGTFIDITSIKEAQVKLEESNADLEQFAFVASHDLREPLRKVKSFGDLLQSRFAADLPAKAGDYLRRMVDASDRMDILIADLLSLSRVSTQGGDFGTVDLRTVVNQVIADLDNLISSTGAVIHVEDLPVLEADDNQMYQLMSNLIGNALKYKKPDVPAVVWVSSRSTADQVEITVRDNGIGFEAEMAEKIFGVFKRLHARSEYEGSGIGLAICKKIVDRHHGRIQASAEPDRGATFTVMLPLWSLAR